MTWFSSGQVSQSIEPPLQDSELDHVNGWLFGLRRMAVIAWQLPLRSALWEASGRTKRYAAFSDRLRFAEIRKRLAEVPANFHPETQRHVAGLSYTSWTKALGW
jgi:hypothetical protein